MITGIFKTTPKGKALCRKCNETLKGVPCIRVLVYNSNHHASWFMHEKCFKDFVNELSNIDYDSKEDKLWGD